MTRAKRARKDPTRRQMRTCRCGFKQVKRRGFLTRCPFCKTGHHDV